MRGRRRLLALLVISLLGVGIRLAFAISEAPDLFPASDADFYQDVASNVAAGRGFQLHPLRPDGAVIPDGPTEATAEHPPGHIVVLAAADLVGLDTDADQRIYLSILAGIGIAATGLLGCELSSARVGLVAATITAVHPGLIQFPGTRQSEASYLVVVPVMLLIAAIAGRQRTWGWFLALGASIGVCALTRVEALLLIPLLLLPLALLRAPRLRLLAVGMAAAVAVIAPWVIRNAVVVDAPTISTNGGVTLAGANCPSAYHGEFKGGFDLVCSVVSAGHASTERGISLEDRGALDADLRAEALRYMRDHPGDLPSVAAARIARIVGVGHFENSLEFDRLEGRHRRTLELGYWMNGVLLVLAAGGIGLGLAGRTRLDRRAAIVLGSAAVMAIVTAVLTYGSSRLRAPAEPAIAVLAAVALVTVWSMLTSGKADDAANAQTVSLRRTL